MQSLRHSDQNVKIRLYLGSRPVLDAPSAAAELGGELESGTASRTRSPRALAPSRPRILTRPRAFCRELESGSASRTRSPIAERRRAARPSRRPNQENEEARLGCHGTGRDPRVYGLRLGAQQLEPGRLRLGVRRFPTLNVQVYFATST